MTPKPQGRPPSLSDRQRAEIGRRLATGEKAIALAREFKVSRSLISTLFSKQVPIVQELASRLASVEGDVAVLPISEQNSIRTLADQLRATNDNLTQAAVNGAKTHCILSRLAVRKAEGIEQRVGEGEIDDDAPGLKAVAQLSATGNEASRVATTLIAAKGKAEDGILTLAELLGG